MRALVVLCLVVVVRADKLGYNYKPVGHSEYSFTPGVSSAHISGTGGSKIGAAFPSFGGGSDFGGPAGGSHGGFGLGASNGGFGGSVSNNGFHSGSGAGGGHIGPGLSYAPHVELEKEFYTFTANEDDFAVPHVENQIGNSAKRSLRVIFIKGPENNGLENAAVALAKHIAEQKTAIYVLHKQADLGSLSSKLNIINSNVNHKPEVHFVKYRTHEDAVNAQKAIQRQYDSLGGVSNNYNGGEAAVLNFASKAPLAVQSSPASHAHSGSPVSFGSSGSPGSSGTFESSGSIGSHGGSAHSGSSSPYVPPSSLSPTYLPA